MTAFSRALLIAAVTSGGAISARPSLAAAIVSSPSYAVAAQIVELIQPKDQIHAVNVRMASEDLDRYAKSDNGMALEKRYPGVQNAIRGPIVALNVEFADQTSSKENLLLVAEVRRCLTPSQADFARVFLATPASRKMWRNVYSNPNFTQLHDESIAGHAHTEDELNMLAGLSAAEVSEVQAFSRSSDGQALWRCMPRMHQIEADFNVNLAKQAAPKILAALKQEIDGYIKSHGG